MINDANIDEPIPVLLSLGSNIGDSASILSLASQFIAEHILESDCKMSSVYKTEPVGYKNQSWFLNLVISGKTRLSQFELINLCKSLEYYLGRTQRKRWHEREIDIDILLYGSKKTQSNGLTIPHPELQNRKFVLCPAAEIASDWQHPLFYKSISCLLDECQDNSQVIKL